MMQIIYNDRVDLSTYILERRDEIRQELARSGAVLFSGYNVETVADFAKAKDAFLGQAAPYHEPSTPRTMLADGVYTSTDFPASRTIALHNELSYAETVPRYLMLACLTPPRYGGSTPIADVREVLRRLPDSLVAEFEARGWALVRNYGTGLGLSIEQVFGTLDRQIINRYCGDEHIEVEWLSDMQLRTVSRRVPVITHPDTGERSWFNHVHFWHESRLEPAHRAELIDEFGYYGLPFNTTYGDGARIPDSVIDIIADAFEAAKTSRPWEAGDVLILDNFVVAHGRESYEGERKVIVAMGDNYRRDAAGEGHRGHRGPHTRTTRLIPGEPH